MRLRQSAWKSSASPVHDPAEIETVIAGFAREPDGGLIVLPSTFMLVHRDLIIGPAERYRLPAIYAFRYFAENGGLISYGNVPADGYRQAATYIDQILRGQSRLIFRYSCRSSTSWS